MSRKTECLNLLKKLGPVPTCLAMYLGLQAFASSPAWQNPHYAFLEVPAFVLLIVFLLILLFGPALFIFVRLLKKKKIWLACIFALVFQVLHFAGEEYIFLPPQIIFGLLDMCLAFSLLAMAILLLQAVIERKQFVLKLAFGCVAVAVCVGILPVGYRTIFDVFVADQQELQEECLSPDKKHSILITKQNVSPFSNDSILVRYFIATSGLFHPLAKFYVQEGTDGENTDYYTLNGVRWFDNERIVYGKADNLQYCSIRHLQNLNSCATVPVLSSTKTKIRN